MFLRFLLMAMLVVAAGSHDAIAEELDVFGFRWKMSYAEASKIASNRMGKMKKVEKLSHYGRTEYEIERPKEPLDATGINLSFFNDELYSMSVNFIINGKSYDFDNKTRGLVEFLKSKHPDAELSVDKRPTAYFWIFTYRDYRARGTGFIENPYNLERIVILGNPDFVMGTVHLLAIHYYFYGAQKITAHIKKLKNEKEFDGF